MSIGRFSPVLLVLVLTGCGSLGAIGFGSNNRPPPEPLTSVASAPVETSPLPPPPGDGTTFGTYPPVGTDPNQPLPPPGNDAVVAAPAAPGGQLSRTDLLGGWNITALQDTCKLFMTLTSWTGGYRASTRGCTSDLLKSISAWNLEGSQVVLSGQSGTEVARLNSAGTGRFDGQVVSDGAPVTFYR
jgi:Protease inhibitor Inh